MPSPVKKQADMMSTAVGAATLLVSPEFFFVLWR
jgi:hypothetical protein